MLTVGELRKVIEGLDGDMPVGMFGYFGECNEFDGSPVVRRCKPIGLGDQAVERLLFPLVYLGEEPE